jgi:hypothetical protein
MMPTLMNFVVRLFLLAAGLLFAASLAAAFVLMLALWSLRAGWARLTRRPVMPFIIRVDPRGGFERMYRHAGKGAAPRRPDGVALRPKLADVTDVEPRPPT